MFSTTTKSSASAAKMGRDFAKNLLGRHISKSSAVPNSDAISRQQKAELNEINATKSKWMRLNKHNNNRALSTIQTKVKPTQSKYTLVSKDESREFMAVFPDIVRDLTDAGRQTDIPEVTKRFAKVLHYNVPNGKKNRGLTLIGAYKMLEKPENLTPENLRLANILGWCVEMLPGARSIVDDIIDHAETRGGSDCWYRNKDVGLCAVVDSLTVNSSIFKLLRIHFSNLSCYRAMFELFHDVCERTVHGQLLDNMTNYSNLDLFNMKTYDNIVKHKISYGSFHLSMALAMYLANIHDKELHRQARTILMQIGSLHQILEDFLDSFGDPQLTGKVLGSDIREGKCSWLAVVALQRATDKQRKILEDCYGQADDNAVNNVINVYKELGLPNTFTVYEEETYNLIRTHIQQISKGLPHEFFFNLLDALYNRSLN